MRLPRIVYDNRFIAAATEIFASSEQASFSRHALREALISEAWKSKAGWNIVAGFNDKLDFSEGVSGDATATITVGNYTSGALLAADMETQLNAAATDNTYTVTYDTTTFEFTVARATGTASFSLEWATGANAAASIGKCIGFDTATDDTGLTSYTSDNAVYKSREYLKFDLQTAAGLNAIAAVATNLGSSDTATIQGNATDVWASPSYSQVLSGTGALRIFNMASQSFRWWRLLLEDQRNSAGISSVGAVFGAPYIEPGDGIDVGYLDGLNPLSVLGESDGGGIFQNKKDSRNAQEVVFSMLSESDKLALEAFETAVGVGGVFLWESDPQNDLTGKTKYMTLAGGLNFRHSVMDGAPPDGYTVGVLMREQIG